MPPGLHRSAPFNPQPAALLWADAASSPPTLHPTPPQPRTPAAGSSSGAAFSFGAASAATGSSSIFSFSTGAAPSFTFAAVGGGAAASGAAAAEGGDAAPAAAAAAPAGGTSLFGATPASGTPLFGAAAPSAAKVELPEEGAVTTGEEDERTVFSGGKAGHPGWLPACLPARLAARPSAVKVQQAAGLKVPDW